MWRFEYDLWESAPSPHHVGPGDGTQVIIRLGGSCRYLLSSPTRDNFWFKRLVSICYSNKHVPALCVHTNILCCCCSSHSGPYCKCCDIGFSVCHLQNGRVNLQLECWLPVVTPHKYPRGLPSGSLQSVDRFRAVNTWLFDLSWSSSQRLFPGVGTRSPKGIRCQTSSQATYSLRFFPHFSGHAYSFAVFLRYFLSIKTKALKGNLPLKLCCLGQGWGELTEAN